MHARSNRLTPHVDISFLPHSPGVYLMRDSSGKIIYIGKAKNLSKRVSGYFKNGEKSERPWKIPNLVALIRRIDYLPCVSERDALVMEQKLIQRHQPFFNQLWKDDKSYPYLKLTLKDDFPRLFLTRKKAGDGSPPSRNIGKRQSFADAEGSLYFGPYPKVTQVTSILRYLRRTGFLRLRECRWDFSVRQKIPYRSCLYYHTGQCPAPCAGKISKRDYRALVKRIVLFLNGRFEKLRKDFARGMEISSRRMNYEKAAVYRDYLKALDHISQRIQIHKLEPCDVEKTIKRLNSFRRSLARLKNVLALKRTPVHIEAFDISNISGKNPVGSMVCFMSGEKFHGHYRRFKIKTAPPAGGGDDFAMIKEIVSRRLAALKNQSLPDLLLIDGGKGQLSSAEAAATELGIKLPIAALAKKNEEIFCRWMSRPVKLQPDDPALQLLQRIRDEAHRFAILYHRQLRTKQLLER